MTRGNSIINRGITTSSSSSSSSRGRRSSNSSNTSFSYRSSFLRYQPKSDSKREAALIKHPRQQQSDPDEFDCQQQFQDIILCADLCDDASTSTYTKPPRNNATKKVPLPRNGQNKRGKDDIDDGILPNHVGCLISVCDNESDEVSTLCCDPIFSSTKPSNTDIYVNTQQRKKTQKASQRLIIDPPNRKSLTQAKNRNYQTDEVSSPFSPLSSPRSEKPYGDESIDFSISYEEKDVPKDKYKHSSLQSSAELTEETSTEYTKDSGETTVKNQFDELFGPANGVMTKYNTDLRLVPKFFAAGLKKHFKHFSENDCEGRLDIFDEFVNEGVEMLFPNGDANNTHNLKRNKPVKYIQLGTKDTQSSGYSGDSDEMSSISSHGKTYAQRTISERTIREKTSDFSSTDSPNDENRIDGGKRYGRENKTSPRAFNVENLVDQTPNIPALKTKNYDLKQKPRGSGLVQKMMVPLGDKCRMEMIRGANNNSVRKPDTKLKLIEKVNSGIKMPSRKRGGRASTPLKEIKAANKANKLDRQGRNSQDEYLDGRSDSSNNQDYVKTTRRNSSQFKRFFSPMKSRSKSTTRGRSPSPVKPKTRDRSLTPLKNKQLSEARLSLPYKNREMSKSTEHLRVILKNRESSRSVASRTRKVGAPSPLSSNRNVQKGLRSGHSKRNVFI